MTTISGTLIQKTKRHDRVSVRNPPAAGPAIVEIPLQAVQVPIARPLASPSKVAVTIASDPGTSRAPASPWIPRNAIRTPVLGRQRAEDRGGAEAGEPDREDLPPSEVVSERAADEHHRDERQQVGLDDPLLAGEAHSEVPLHRRQRDVHHRRVEEDHRRGEDRGDEGETLPAGHLCESAKRS